MDGIDRVRFFEKLHQLSESDLQKVIVAYWLAKDVHRTQFRDGGERYFEHVRGVALLLIQHGYQSAEILVRAFLHDLIEDTATPFWFITSQFGEVMLESLKTLSKKVPVFNPRNGQVLMRLLVEDSVYYANLMAASENDRLVKCADRLHNLRSMSPWPKDKQVEYAHHTQQFVIPLARITSSVFAAELEVEVNKVLVAA